jgi:hypothetical protein
VRAAPVSTGNEGRPRRRDPAQRFGGVAQAGHADRVGGGAKQHEIALRQAPPAPYAVLRGGTLPRRRPAGRRSGDPQRREGEAAAFDRRPPVLGAEAGSRPVGPGRPLPMTGEEQVFLAAVASAVRPPPAPAYSAAARGRPGAWWLAMISPKGPVFTKSAWWPAGACASAKRGKTSSANRYASSRCG